MADAEVLISPSNVDSALVLRLAGPLVGGAVASAQEKLTDISAAVPPPHLVVPDLRAVSGLSAAGARVLSRFVTAQAERSARTAAVVEDGGVVFRVLRTATPVGQLRVYGTVDAAMAFEPHPSAEVDELGGRLAALSRVLLDATTLEQALRPIVAATVVIIPHAQVVNVTLRDPAGRFFTPNETDGVAAVLDQAQYAAGSGPCVDAARPDGPGYALALDLTAATAWPQFAAVAAQPRPGLAAADGPAAAVGRRRRCEARSTSTATAKRSLPRTATGRCCWRPTRRSRWRATPRRRSPSCAPPSCAGPVESRDVIGQAKGILMARQGLTADEAFDLLRRTSQTLNLKLAQLAATLVERHGELASPGLAGTGASMVTLSGPPFTPAREAGHPPAVSSASHRSRSPGWHSSTSQSAASVVKRTALARPFLSTARLAGVIPTRSASSPTDIFRLASITSMSTAIGIR